MTDEEALIRAAQANDPAAFERLLERRYDTIYRFAVSDFNFKYVRLDPTAAAWLWQAPGS